METITYSHADSLDIKFDIYLPSPLPSGELPALIFFHGGGMLAGGRKTLIFQQWLKAAALENNILFLSVDYRLIHPSTAFDIIADTKQLSTFLASPDFSKKHLPPGTSLDTTRLAASGESGGGYPAIATCLFASLKPKVALLQYAMGGELLGDHWLAVKDGPMLAPGADKVTRKSLAHILDKPQAPICYDPIAALGDEGAGNDVGRVGILPLLWREGTLLDFVLGREGVSKELRGLPYEQRFGATPVELRPAILEAQLREGFPPTVLLHGTDDMMVSPEESKRMYRRLREVGVRAELLMAEGGGHALLNMRNPPNLVEGAKEMQQKAWRFVLDELRK